MQTVTRRRFAVAALAPAVLRRATAAPAARVEEIRTISLRAENYHGWPTLARRKNGELLVTCSGGREAHVCPFGRVELIRSTDGGEHWSWPQVVMDTAI